MVAVVPLPDIWDCRLLRQFGSDEALPRTTPLA
jgi:hypothetical protein